MKVEATLTGIPRSWPRTSRVVRPDRSCRGRPRLRFRVSITTPSDAREARRLGVPVYLLTPEVVTALGYPVQFPPHLLIPRDLEAVVDSALPRILVDSSETARDPGIEDVIAALLSVDSLAARGIAVRHRGSIDARQLLRRVVQSEREAEATRVGLQEFAPGIPLVGRPLPRPQLDAQDRDVQVIGLRA